MMDEIIEKWDSNTPLFHISEQAVSKKRVGAHSDFIYGIHFIIIKDYKM